MGAGLDEARDGVVALTEQRGARSNTNESEQGSLGGMATSGDRDEYSIDVCCHAVHASCARSATVEFGVSNSKTKTLKLSSVNTD
jgi:hypothetical protein